MKNTRTIRIIAIAAALLGLSTVLLWNLWGGGTPVGAMAEERQNQNRIRQELPRPNESAPRHAGAADTPR